MYSVQINETDYYRVTTRPSQSAPTADTRIYLMDDASVLIDHNDDSDDTPPYSLLETRLHRGTYLVLVSNFFFFKSGGYTLSVEPRPPVPAPQQSNDLTVDADRPVSGGIGDGVQDVWYRFQAETPGSFLIETSGPSSEEGLDTVIELYSVRKGGLVLVDENDDKGENDRYSLLTQELQAGDHYVRVSRYVGTTMEALFGGTESGGEFRISVSIASSG